MNLGVEGGLELADEPENSMIVCALLTLLTLNPCDSSQTLTVWMSASDTPYCAPNCSGVSHLRY